VLGSSIEKGKKEKLTRLHQTIILNLSQFNCSLSMIRLFSASREEKISVREHGDEIEQTSWVFISLCQAPFLIVDE
jgi:hypothetical protein